MAQCSIDRCTYPGAGPCDFCGLEPCANHTKRCPVCRNFYCSAQLKICVVAHTCVPKRSQKSFIEEQLGSVR